MLDFSVTECTKGMYIYCYMLFLFIIAVSGFDWTGDSSLSEKNPKKRENVVYDAGVISCIWLHYFADVQ